MPANKIKPIVILLVAITTLLVIICFTYILYTRDTKPNSTTDNNHVTPSPIVTTVLPTNTDIKPTAFATTTVTQIVSPTVKPTLVPTRTPVPTRVPTSTPRPSPTTVPGRTITIRDYSNDNNILVISTSVSLPNTIQDKTLGPICNYQQVCPITTTPINWICTTSDPSYCFVNINLGSNYGIMLLDGDTDTYVNSSNNFVMCSLAGGRGICKN